MEYPFCVFPPDHDPHFYHEISFACQVPQKLSSLAVQGRGFAASSDQEKQERSVSLDGEKNSLATDLEQATGLER